MSILRTAAAIVLIPAATVAAAPEWVDSLGLDVFGVGAFQQEIRNELEREQNLELTNQEVRRRIEIKDGLIAELIAGRKSLAQVSARFLALNRERPEYLDVIRATYPGSTDEERTARNVIGYVEGELLWDKTPRKAEVLARLRAELECLRGEPVTTR